MLRALWGGPETVIVISSDLSHYHPHEVARALDDQTIADIAALHLPIHPRRACGAYPINGLLDVLKGRKDMKLFELGCSTSGDDGVVALAGQPRPAMRDADEPVVGYVSFAAWESKPEAGALAGADDLGTSGTPSHGEVLLKLARAAIRERLHIEHPTTADSTASILAANPWLNESGACFVTLTGYAGALVRWSPTARSARTWPSTQWMPPPATHVSTRSPPRNTRCSTWRYPSWVSPSRLP